MYIRISLAQQTLELFNIKDACLRRYFVSTAKNGAGAKINSHCTPLGRHRIRARIGAGMPAGTVFQGRRPTGEIWNSTLAAQHPGRDWITSRILWLCGEELGKNRLGNVDTMRRYIYIHGTGDDQLMDHPNSQGCIRMYSRDIIELFELVRTGTPVDITE